MGETARESIPAARMRRRHRCMAPGFPGLYRACTLNTGSIPHGPTAPSAQRYRIDLRRLGAAHGRRALGVSGRTRDAGRAQRIGQVDAAEDRRRAGRTGSRLGVRAAGRAGALPAAGAGFLRLCLDAGVCRGRTAGRPTMCMPPSICSSNSALPDRKIRRGFRAARRAASRLPACWCPPPIFCCSTSRPIISI